MTLPNSARHRAEVLAIYQELGWQGTSNAADAFQRVVPSARIVRLPRGSDHYVWETNEAQVLCERRVFIRGLARTPRTELRR